MHFDALLDNYNETPYFEETKSEKLMEAYGIVVLARFCQGLADRPMNRVEALTPRRLGQTKLTAESTGTSSDVVRRFVGC